MEMQLVSRPQLGHKIEIRCAYDTDDRISRSSAASLKENNRLSGRNDLNGANRHTAGNDFCRLMSGDRIPLKAYADIVAVNGNRIGRCIKLLQIIAENLYITAITDIQSPW